MGRTPQWAALNAELEAMIATGVRFALIGGDAGTGKTSLVDRFVAGLNGRARVVRGECVPMGDQGLAFAPIAGTLRSLINPPAHHRIHLRVIRAWLLVWLREFEEADRALMEFRHLQHDDGLVAPQYLSLLVHADGTAEPWSRSLTPRE